MPEADALHAPVPSDPAPASAPGAGVHGVAAQTPAPQPEPRLRSRVMGSGRRGIELPEDAAGRVAFIAVQLPPDGERVPYDGGSPAPGKIRSPGFLPDGVVLRALRSFTAAGPAGWLAVSALGVVLVLVFLLGLNVAR